MRIKQHDTSHIVELSDGSTWRIWPGDLSKTLEWLPATELDVAPIEDDICSYALVAHPDGTRVRVISANEDWPPDVVRRALRGG